MKKKSLSCLFLVAIAASLLCGCNNESFMKALLKKITPPEDDKFAQQYVEIVRNRDFDKALVLLDPEIRQTVQQDVLEEIADDLNKGEISSVEELGCNVFYEQGKKTVTLEYEYKIADTWTTVTIVVENIDGQQQILDFEVSPTPKSIKEINAFSFFDKDGVHYGFLILVISIGMLVFYALVLCIKSQIRKKWLWIILIFAGIGELVMNWSTGEIFFNLFSLQIQLLGFSAFKAGLAAPWEIKTFIPVGAIVFLLKRKELIKRGETISQKQGKVAG